MASPKHNTASAPCLTCYFRTQSESGDTAGKKTSGKALLCQETGKKSSFLLQPKQNKDPHNGDTNDSKDWYSVPKPAHLFVKHESLPTTASKQDSTFFFGGLQLVFDAKNIEIYLTNPEGKESYLMTCKGIPYKVNEKENLSQESTSAQKIEWRRALCVVPGGPRCISSLRIKLIGSSTTLDSTRTKIQYLKLTARVSDSATTSSRSAELASPTTTSLPQGMKNNLPTFNPGMLGLATAPIESASQSEPPLTQKDLGAAMAGLSFMARKTEENMANLFKEHSQKVESQLESYLMRIELQMRALKPTLAMQQQLIKENQIIMKEQQQIMNEQASQISKLLCDNQDLQVRVQSLQADISIIRSHTDDRNSRIDDNESANVDADVSKRKLTTKDPPSEETLDEAKKKKMQMENAHLRKVIKNVSRGIDGEPLFGGCGGTEYADDSVYASLGMDEESNVERENIRLKNAIRNVSRGIDEDPCLEGCGATPTIYAENEALTASNPVQKAEEKVLVVANPPPSADLSAAKKRIQMENARLRNVIQSVARGIDGQPLKLAIDENNIELENIRLKNAVRTISRGIDDDPCTTGCGASPTSMYP